MADNISILDGSNVSQTIATTEISGVDFQKVILADSTTGAPLTAYPVTDPDAVPANCWAVCHAPAANTQATILKAATSAKRHVVTSITATLAAGASAPSAVQVGVSLIQDAAGTPVTLWAAVLALQAVAGDRCGVTKPCYIPTSATNKSLTLEFSAAGGANTIEAVSMEGITLSV